ncbi:hypothetical protein [Salinicola halophilus]|uniref:hypothetical protein n=1 Tax=Salinicola halophilus TaxID=184065 RepID=UPI000DA20F1C|nr:hypothetical protein [Salinicola halophilus]
MQKYNYAIVNDEGFIERTHAAPNRYIEVGSEVSDTTHYFDHDADEIRKRESYELEQSLDGLTLTLTGLPDGTRATVAGHQDIARDGALKVEFDQPGSYNVFLEAGPRYMDCEFDVEVGG